MAEEPSLSYYLPIAGGRIMGFIPFPRVLVLCEMQSVSSRIWTRIAVFISYGDNDYTTGTSIVGKVIHWELCKKLKLNHTKKWYMDNLESVPENETHKIHYDFEIQTDHLIPARRLDRMRVNKKKRKEKQLYGNFKRQAGEISHEKTWI